MWKLKYNTFSEFSNDNSNEKSNDIRYSTDIQYNALNKTITYKLNNSTNYLNFYINSSYNLI